MVHWPLLAWIKDILGWETKIVPNADNEFHQKWVLLDGEPVLVRQPRGGFQVQPKRWVVENTQSQDP